MYLDTDLELPLWVRGLILLVFLGLTVFLVFYFRDQAVRDWIHQYYIFVPSFRKQAQEQYWLLDVVTFGFFISLAAVIVMIWDGVRLFWDKMNV